MTIFITGESDGKHFVREYKIRVVTEDPAGPTFTAQVLFDFVGPAATTKIMSLLLLDSVLYCGDEAGFVYAWDIAAGEDSFKKRRLARSVDDMCVKLRTSWEAHTKALVCMVEWEGKLATGGRDGTIKLWKKLLSNQDGSTKIVTKAALEPEEEMASKVSKMLGRNKGSVMMAMDGGVKDFSNSTNVAPIVTMSHDGKLSPVAHLFAVKKFLYSTHSDGYVMRWNIGESSSKVDPDCYDQRWKAHDSVTSIYLLGNYLWTSGSKGDVTVWT
eukprot:TRINITY_DN3833_c0_g1_i1.p1 TRINITY_DN3833_c0_g1~~TRINITY_DN3833_c0_g1_i1.p1  ORF type:complete len:309 (+),score=44.39 TRINITY_DN3833_c0_g1_i1:115-927(+)